MSSRAARSTEATQPREKLRGRNAFLSVSLVEGGKQLSLLLRREFYNRFVASSEDGHGRSLWQREAFDNDLAANDGA